MTTQTGETFSLELKRVIKAPRARVYQAWADPAQLRAWFGPKEVHTDRVTADPRAGGKLQWDLTTSEGEKMTMCGEFRELVPDRRIVFTWQWQDDEVWEGHISTVTIELADAEGGTELTFRHEQIPTEQSRDNHRGGWTSLLDKLETYLAV